MFLVTKVLEKTLEMRADGITKCNHLKYQKSCQRMCFKTHFLFTKRPGLSFNDIDWLKRNTQHQLRAPSVCINVQLYSVRNSVGGHDGAAAHNSKAVLSVFIQSKAKNQEDKTHSRGIKPAGKNSKPRKEGTKVKTQRTNQIRNAQLLFTQKTRQTGNKVKESLVDIHKEAGTTRRHRWDALGTLPQVGVTDWLKSVLVLDTSPQVQNTFYSLAFCACLKMNCTFIWIK